MKKEFKPNCILCGEEIKSSKYKAMKCPACRDLFEKERARLMKMITKRANYNVWKIRGKKT